MGSRSKKAKPHYPQIVDVVTEPKSYRITVQVTDTIFRLFSIPRRPKSLTPEQAQDKVFDYLEHYGES